MSMLIRSLALKNFRCFSQYQLTLAPRFTVLIGDNGSGKTAVLDALAVAAGAFLLGIPKATARSIGADDVRRVDVVLGQSLSLEDVGETEVTAQGDVNGQLMTWKRTLANSKGRTTRKFALAVQEATGAMVRESRTRRRSSFPCWPITAREGSGTC